MKNLKLLTLLCGLSFGSIQCSQASPKPITFENRHPVSKILVIIAPNEYHKKPVEETQRFVLHPGAARHTTFTSPGATVLFHPYEESSESLNPQGIPVWIASTETIQYSLKNDGSVSTISYGKKPTGHDFTLLLK